MKIVGYVNRDYIAFYPAKPKNDQLVLEAVERIFEIMLSQAYRGVSGAQY